MKAGDKMMTCGKSCEIIAVERKYKGAIPGRYTVRFENGDVVVNYPGYLLKPAQGAASSSPPPSDESFRTGG